MDKVEQMLTNVMLHGDKEKNEGEVDEECRSHQMKIQPSELLESIRNLPGRMVGAFPRETAFPSVELGIPSGKNQARR